MYVKGYWFEDSRRAFISFTALKGDVTVALVRDVSGVDVWVVLPYVFIERSDGIYQRRMLSGDHSGILCLGFFVRYSTIRDLCLSECLLYE